MNRAAPFLLFAFLAGCGQQQPVVVQPSPPQVVPVPTVKPLPYTFQVFPEYAGEQHIYRLNQETGEVVRINVVRQKDNTFISSFQTVSPQTP